MSTLVLTPSRSLVAADLLKLRRRRGLVAVTALLTVGAMAITYGIIELLHVANPAKYGPAGGAVNLGHGAWVALAFGAVAAAIVGSVAGSGDLEAGVYRDLVVTGRSRLALYRSRLRGGLVFLLPFTAAGYAIAGFASVVFAGGHPVPSVSLLVTTGLWAALQTIFYYLLAFGIACLVGSRSYTIGILLAFRLALTPILASISALGIVRELVPGVALQGLTPAALGNSAQQGPSIPMSTAAIAAVLIVWAVTAVAAGALRDTRRDV
jgi:ABC-type transport system involved in multi-copper enzyme maturation permease subunit